MESFYKAFAWFLEPSGRFMFPNIGAFEHDRLLLHMGTRSSKSNGRTRAV
jgi:hypothetical protein